MVKLSLKKFKSFRKDAGNDVSSLGTTSVEEVDENPTTGETMASNDSIEVEERQELFSKAAENNESISEKVIEEEKKSEEDVEEEMKSEKDDEEEPKSEKDDEEELKSEKGDEEELKSGKGDEDEEEDLHDMLENMEIPDFDMSDSDEAEEEEVEEEVDDPETSSEEGSVDYADRMKREEVFSKRYRPSKSENRELEELAKRLRVSSSSVRLTTCQSNLHELIFGKHSIVLKKGPVNFNNTACELLLLTDGFIAAYQKVSAFSLGSLYDTCQLWSDVQYVEVANFGTLKIKMQSGEKFEMCSTSDGENLKTWFEAIELVLILCTIHGSNASTMTDVLGWQYQRIRKPAFTAAVTQDMKLMGNPRSINQLDDYNQSSPLHYAVQHEACSTDIVDALLRAGADPNLPDGEGRSAMYYAQRNGLSEIEDILRQHGGKGSKLAEIELKGELFAGVEEAEKNTERRREIEQTEKDNKAAEAMAKAESAQSQMSQNMAAMLERGEKISEMDDKAQQLNNEAQMYAKLASQLKDQVKNKKWYQI